MYTSSKARATLFSPWNFAAPRFPCLLEQHAPLTRPLEDASWFHGQDGLGDHGYQPATRAAEDDFAVDAMAHIIEATQA